MLIICPVRNEAKHISRLFHSLLAQSHSNWTLFIGDNASTDGTSKIVSDMVASDSRFVVKSFETSLPVHENFKRTISQALDFCQYDYVQFVGADDHFGEASYFRDGILALTENKESLIACGAVQAFTPEKMLESISFEGLAVQATAEARRRFSAKNYWTCNLIYGFYQGHHFSSTFKSPLAEFTPNLSSDWWFSLIASEAHGVTYLENFTYMKFRKSIEYSEEHYTLLPSKRARFSAIRGVLLFPWGQISDRIKVLGARSAVKFLILFQARELKSAYNAFRSR